MAGIFTSIGEKLGLRGGGDKIQYLLAGTLVLVIIISLIAAITTFSGKKGRTDGLRFYDTETGKEFTLTAKEMDEQVAQSRNEGLIMHPRGAQDVWGVRWKNPETQKRTGIAMTKCLKCEKWFVPAFLRSEDPEEVRNARKVCEHCGTDQSKYSREQRMRKKK